MKTVPSLNAKIGWITQVEVCIQKVNWNLDWYLLKKSFHPVTFLAPAVKARKKRGGKFGNRIFRLDSVFVPCGLLFWETPWLRLNACKLKPQWINCCGFNFNAFFDSLSITTDTVVKQPLRVEDGCRLQIFSQANILQQGRPNYYLFSTLLRHKADIFLIIHMR